MKTMMNILLVVFMLLFTFNSQSQVYEVGCGSDYDNWFSDDQEHEFGYLNFPYNNGGLDNNGCRIFWYIGEKSFTYTFKGIMGGVYDLVLDYKEEFTNEYKIKVNDITYTFEIDGPKTISGVNLEGDVEIYFELTNAQTTELKSFKLESTASLQESNLDQLFKVYSFNDEINIQTTEFKNYDFKVYNMYGGLVTENTNLIGDFKRKIAESGIYIVKLQFENEILTRKILIK